MMMIAKIKQLLGMDIKEKEYAYGQDEFNGYMSARTIPDKWVKTTCGYCSVGCGILAGVKGNKIVTVRGDSNHPVNNGTLCPKGLSEHQFINSPKRALTPLIKKEGAFWPLSWNNALKLMVTQVKSIQSNYGKNSFAVLSTGQLLTEEFYALGKLVQLGFGTSSYDGNTTLCMSSAVVGYKQSFGSDGPPGSYKGLQEADVIFLIGANIADNHPILWNHLSKNMSRKLIVMDPRKTKTAMFGDLFLPIEPHGDIAVLNWLINMIIHRGRANLDYIRDHTTGFEELKKSVQKYDTHTAMAMSGLSEEKLEKAYAYISSAKKLFCAWTMGVNHSTQGSDTVSLINTLNLILGQIGKTGAAPMSITGQCNAMGSREFSFSSAMPGYRKFEKKEDREYLSAFWNVPLQSIPEKRGLAYPDIITGILEGHIKGLWVIATNPLISFPDQHRLQEALAKLDFLVVQDGFHPTPTGEIADLILPAAMWGEKEGTYTNSERRVSMAQKAVPPPGDAKSDFDIFLDIAEELSVKETLFSGWTKAEDAFSEMKKISEGRLCDYSGMSYKLILEKGGIQWPCNEKNPEGTDSLYADGRFETSDGKACLLSVDPEELPEDRDHNYPLILNTGRTVEHWHTGTKTMEIPILRRLSPEAWVEIHPQTAKNYQIKPTDRISIVSRRGRVDGFLVRITETVSPRQVFIPFHFAKQCVNKLTLAAFDPKSREPNYKQCAVKIDVFNQQSQEVSSCN